jgi:hypothetical protein
MNIVPLIVGSIFFTFGAGICARFIHFRLEGNKVKGRVKAIEKFVSKTKTSNNGQSSQLMYRAIVEYVFRGETRIVSSISTSTIRHKLNQRLSVFVLIDANDDIQARINDLMVLVFGGLFSMTGLVTVLVYVYAAEGSSTLAVIALAACMVLGYLGSILLKKFNVPVRSSEDSQTIDPSSTLIETSADYQAEIASLLFWGRIIACVMLLTGMGFAYWGYAVLGGAAFQPAEFQDLIADGRQLYQLVESGDLQEKWYKPLILIGMASVFILGSLHSLSSLGRRYS